MAGEARPRRAFRVFLNLLFGAAGFLFLGGCTRASVPISTAAPPRSTSTISPIRTIRPTLAPSPTSSPPAQPTSTTGPTPSGGAAELIFGIVERIGDAYTYGPIIRYHLVDNRATEVTQGGYELLGVGMDGDRLLARRDDVLVVLDMQGTEKVVLTELLYDSPGKPAVWIPGTRSIVFLETGSAGARVVIVDEGGGERRVIRPDELSPREVMPPSASAPLVILGEPCASPAQCESAYAVEPTVLDVKPLTDRLRPVFSPGGQYLAYLYEEGDRRRLALAPADGSRQVRMGVPGDNILDYVWSPESDELLVIALVRSDYSGRWFGARQFLLTPGTWSMVELPSTETANAKGIWSLDGRQVILAGTEPAEGGYEVTLRRIDLVTRDVQILEPPLDLVRPNYVFLSYMAWRALR
ncbi:MAG TPA: hypothetical protein VFI11_01035 [Anaerolineales bacterium]|nr:hypothetical protein [Anaerolineales bacterium]